MGEPVCGCLVLTINYWTKPDGREIPAGSVDGSAGIQREFFNAGGYTRSQLRCPDCGRVYGTYSRAEILGGEA